MKFFSTIVALLFAVQAFAFVTATRTSSLVELEGFEVIGELPGEATNMTANDFLNMTPKKYKEMTGKKLGLKNTLKLKAAQKLVRKHFDKENATDFPKGAYIVLVILGWGWLAMGLMDDFGGNNWWVNLLLVILCWLPGVIHGFAKMKEYY